MAFIRTRSKRRSKPLAQSLARKVQDTRTKFFHLVPMRTTGPDTKRWGFRNGRLVALPSEQE